MRRAKDFEPSSMAPSHRPASPYPVRHASPHPTVTGYFRLGATASSGYNVRVVARATRRGPSRWIVSRHGDAHRTQDAWAIAVPILTSMQPAAAGVALAAHTSTIWRTEVRFIGAGAIAVASIYTLATLAKPVISGLVSTLAASKVKNTGDDSDRDIHPTWIYVLAAACLA